MLHGVAIRTAAGSTQDVTPGGPVAATWSRRLAMAALMLLPGALIVFMGFNAGGYFPATAALATLVVTQVVLVRIMLARHPFEGLAPATIVAIAALALYALMTLLSAAWSHSTGRAIVEFGRCWLYLLVLVLFGSVRPGTRDLRWLIRGLVIGCAVVCLAGLASRVLPNVWHTAPGVANERLSYPVTYWNALGLLAALGIVLAFHLTCTLGERRLVQVLAAALVPLLAATLLLTFSRGAIATCVIGLVVYVLAARPRGLPSGVLATAPPSAVLLVATYHANLLDKVDPTTPAAVSQGHRVALTAGICATGGAGLRAILAITLDPGLRRTAGRTRLNPRLRLAAVACVIAALLVAGEALGVGHRLEHDWQRFVSGVPTQGGTNLPQRLTDPSNNGRTDLWRVALNGFSASTLHGYGSGMYQTLWDHNRPVFFYTVNAHSLYFQTMAELGIPGLVLLVILVGAVLVGLGVRARGSRRSIYGALLAACAVWALRAGVDWDWEMPVVTLVFFAIAGAGLSPRGRFRRGWVPSTGARIALGLFCLITLVVPVVILGSQSRLDDAKRALYAGNCAKASSASLSSIRWLDVRPEAHEILGLCDIERGVPKRGVAAMRRAVHYDPGSWETYFALALAQGAAGIDPRPAAARALQMNPLEPLTQQEVRGFQTSSPSQWVKHAATLHAAALASNDLSLVPS